MGTCSDGCGARAVEASSAPAYVRALWLVVMMNGGMFILGVVASILSGSVSVRSDMLDFLGDSIATGIGLILVGRSARVRATASLWQGVVLGMLGAFALVTALARFWSGEPPEALEMGLYGVLGLAVNTGAALLLLRHRHGDANVRAVWLYSRNDALGNIAVLIAAVAVVITNSKLPDIIAGVAIAFLFSHSAYGIVNQARRDKAALSLES